MKKRILTYFIYVIAAAIITTTVLMTVLAYNMFERQILENLRVSAQMFSAMIEEEGSAQGIEDMGRGLRVTLLRDDGTVYYDNMADPAGMDSHAGRPEVVRALETGEGSYIRHSKTLDSSTFYFAVRLDSGDVLRVAQEASSIWSVYLRALPLILLVMLLMMGLCVYAARVLTRRLIEPIEQMTAHLDHMEGVARYPELEPFMGMIKKQHEEILKSADMRVEFTANVSHELKTPLTSISGYAELIESGMAAGEQATRFAGEIHKSADRLLALINDIIRLSQMDSPAQELTLEAVDLAQIAENTAEQLRMNAEKMGVLLEIDARAAVIQADRRMMEELIYNLCDNAIRYNVHGGSVRLTVRPVKERAIVVVQDTGIGISRENQEHVFERFYRVDKSRSKATGEIGRAHV